MKTIKLIVAFMFLAAASAYAGGAVSPSPDLTAADVNIPRSEWLFATSSPNEGAQAVLIGDIVRVTPPGGNFIYSISGGWTFDDPDTSVIETQNLSNLSSIIVGVKGGIYSTSGPTLGMCLIDVNNASDCVSLLSVNDGTEQYWSVPSGYFTNDRSHIKKVSFGIGYTYNASGTHFDIRTVEMTSGSFAEFVISDFNVHNGNPPNNVGGIWGEWPSDSPCEFTPVLNDALHNPAGHSMQLHYDVNDPNPYVACAFWEQLGPNPVQLYSLDGSAYKSLSFYVKGDRSSQFSSKGKVELKDVSFQPKAVIVESITRNWKKVTIPYLQFERTPLPSIAFPADDLDQSQLAEFAVRFDKNTAQGILTGDILIDHVTLSTQVAPLTVANFDPELPFNTNNIAGLVGSWNCGFENTLGNVALTYGINNEVNCAFWSQFKHRFDGGLLDASDYKSIQFDVKGDVNAGVPSRLKLDLSSMGQFGVPVFASGYISGVAGDWKTYSIPIVGFGDKIDKAVLNELAIGSNYHLLPTSEWQGKFYIDNIKLTPKVSEFLVADFNLGTANPSFARITNYYGQYGAFSGGGVCSTIEAPDAGRNPNDRSVRVDFSEMAASNPYCGLWVNLSSPMNQATYVNASDYRVLSFKVKGDKPAGFPSQLRVDMYTLGGLPGGPTHPNVHVPVTSEWKTVVVPLDQLASISELQYLQQIAFTIDSNDPQSGAIYIDDVKLSPRRLSEAQLQAVPESLE